LVYDISNRKSFDKIKNYYCDKIKEFCKNNIPILLLGNKADKEKEREISQEEGITLSLSNNFKFKEASCLKNENVADAFESLIELWNIEYLKNKSIPKKSENVQLVAKNNRKIKNKECCN
jgi:GTPase SAR1 family protein